uniref:Chromodomain helicase DNA binding protein 6 n=1 Tax=Scleropages formosus TaxID=113540 RepID=A0A8C9VQN7_SCLFO
MAHAKQAGSGEPGPGAGRPSPSPLSLPLNGEEDDGGGGGARVKKKRKKKDKKEVDFWQKSEKETRPKKKKEVSEGKELLPRKSKELKKVKELKPPKESKKGRKSREKRRSGRQVKRRKYNEDLDFKVVDDDGETIAVLGTGRIQEPPEDEANIIEKILAVRTVKKEVQPTLSNDHFYVSYLHCKWATLEELEKDPRIHQKIKRFRNKQAQMKHIFTEPDEDLFNPDYIEVDRLLEVAYTTDTETGEEVTHYLVKWCSLPYEESTWELQEDVDPAKIREFEDIKKIPELKHVERPLPEQWKKLEQSREYRNGNQLREYQLEGMNWLLFNWYNRKNCILADEMGLGKTIQSITFLYEIFSMGIKGPFLIIAPLSTITNWEREFRTWTEMNVIVYHGSQISRQMILQYEMYHKDEQSNPLPGMFKFHGVITTFEMIMADCPELKKIHWRCVVIDEAHRLKNRNCKLLEGLKLMNLEHKVLLTGTPLQNSVEELFSLLNFLEPLQFPSETSFLEEFGDLKTDEQVKKLQAILKPMMLRRLKDDVEKNLAPKEETIIEVELTNIQKKYYRAILEKNFTFLAKGANQHNMPNLINTMMELRKCCNHPYLITGAEEKILEGFKKMHNPDAWDFQLQAMIQAAGKLVLIDKLLPKLIAGGHKVLIFSQMVRCLDILEDYLIQRRYTYERIDGRVRGNLRQAAIDRFCKVDSDRFVFLLCTRAGGLGINLTAADTCIIFDSDWNPQNDLQAQARCHRIGQSKAVKVYRLITRNSYEREMFDKASLKLGLDKAVLQDINRKGGLNGVQQLTKMEVEDLLRKGAYGALMDEEDEGSKFCEEDIDQILQRRTQTITIQTEGKGSTFAKASFVSSGNRTDISLDDPNFWQKWAKIAELEIDSKAEKVRESLVIDTPRVRKQTRHYNSFEEDELMEFSELDSDSEERPCRTRRLSERNRRYLRAECFRVEKNLLIFGWGRWKDILTHGRFKWHLSERDMELLCRALLVYCVRHYKGDDKIKSFIWDLITPTKDGQNEALQNHSGLSVPVPRGRKGKKLKNQLCQPELKNADWLVHCNPEVVLQDDSYKKHLKQHCNKVLLRVRMLYYLKVEVLGEAANQALEGIPASKLEVALPDIDYLEIPASWWDTEADKSLLIGVHKHGYERYNAMRADADLCFLERVGMPDVTALSVEQSGGETSADATDRIRMSFIDQVLVMVQDNMEQGRAVWPTGSALTARLRRLITAYQRFTRREPLRHDFLMPEGAGPMAWQLGEEFRRITNPFIPLFCLFLVMSSFSLLFFLSRWTRREQADFYRTVSSFGVVYDPEKKAFDWTQFRSFARLERKTDESLERYFCSFVAMCRTACRLPPRKDEGPLDPTLFVEPITEERAARTLYRIELLRKVREQVLRHPLLGQRLQLCQPSLYLPVWWECGKHDRDLLIGVARHGLSRTDYYILNDPQLSFLEAHRNYYVPPPISLSDMSLHHQRGPDEPEEKLSDSDVTHSVPSPGDVAESVTFEFDKEELSRDSQSLAGPEPDPEVDPDPEASRELSEEQGNVGDAANAGDMADESTLSEHTFAADEPASPSLPVPQADTPVSSGTEVVSQFKQEFSLEPLSSDSKPDALEAESTVASPSMEQTGMLEVKDEIKEERPKSPGTVSVFSTRFSFVLLQDRVIINRIDSICHAVLKGKWPSSQQYESPSSLGNTCVPNSAPPRAAYIPARVQPQQNLNFSISAPVSHLPKSRPEGVNQSTVSVPSSSAPPEHPPVPPQPESLPLDRETANKGLLEWLRQNPNYTMEMPVGILHSFVDRPKQRRHRCKDPSKLDVNSLTGEERVPVVHRATGRRLGGAMAPALKELSRWLDANSDYCVAPDWADIVKHSGFLPEGKFTRILTEPVCRDSGPRKRGRRPRNDMPKVGAMLSEAHSSMGPLFMNGLIGNMDLMGLRNMPSIPLTGLMGFPHGFAAVPAGEDAKNGLSMLPMMLHGMQPHVFSVGGLMSQSATAVTGASAEGEPTSSEADAETKKEDKPLVEGKAGPAHSHGEPAIVLGTNSSGGSSGSGGGSGSHLAFNPFLIPGMSHGLLYPHMFLPHGGIMALPSMPHADSSGSPKRKKKKLREEGAEEAGVKGSPQTDSVRLRVASDSQTDTRESPVAGSEWQTGGGVEANTDPPPHTPPGAMPEEGPAETNVAVEMVQKAASPAEGEKQDEEQQEEAGKEREST